MLQNVYSSVISMASISCILAGFTVTENRLSFISTPIIKRNSYSKYHEIPFLFIPVHQRNAIGVEWG